jgi:hypothetical protein
VDDGSPLRGRVGEGSVSETSKQSLARGLGYLGLLLALFAALTPGYFYIPGLLALACGVAALLLREGYLGLLSIGFAIFGTLIGFILTLVGFRLGK